MPFDAVPARSLVRRDRRAVAWWLFGCCAMLVAMITLGGATRLTGSGLSIMEWAPLSGALPPWSEAEWQRLFRLYQQVPQYKLLHEGFGLDGFKQIFWLEWVHRLWGRLIGVVFLVPLLVFWARGALGRRLLSRLLLLLVLGGLQGAIGWFMVSSGFFADSISVSAYRLVVHLTLALTLYAALVWTGLSVLRSRPVGHRPLPIGTWLSVLTAAVGATIVAGGFVAGLHAGLIYNTFPLMDGQIVPAGYGALSPWVRNLFENTAAVQFDHRLVASGTLLLATVIVVRAWPERALRQALAAIGTLVAAQYTLGVMTLLAGVPAWLGTAHQAGAVLLLTATLVALHLARNPALTTEAR